MTRKDYIIFAAMFRTERERARSVGDAMNKFFAFDPVTRTTCADLERAAIDQIILRAADIFAVDNPRFDRDRFLRASGL